MSSARIVEAVDVLARRTNPVCQIMQIPVEGAKRPDGCIAIARGYSCHMNGPADVYRCCARVYQLHIQLAACLDLLHPAPDRPRNSP